MEMIVSAPESKNIQRPFALASLVETLSSSLGPNDAGFLQRVYEDGLEKYRNRLHQIGFHRLDTVLDAGCGFGQWAFALASDVEKVIGVDVSNNRINVCNQLAKYLGIENTHFLVATLENLPLPTESVDGIFCYSTIYLTDYRKTLKEFYRILRKGGRIYICTNGPGRYVYEIIQNPRSTPDFNMRLYALKTFRNTLLGRWHHLSAQNGARIMSPSATKRRMEQIGFHILGIGPEGSVEVTRMPKKAEPFHSATYLGLTNVFEILAKK
ncbi:MAG: methyltransferase domain-containing protein [candidate division KSB1 bacterium]|nr:methyltransferase domain-containing protein [candidate division KSB1 bacterium]